MSAELKGHGEQFDSALRHLAELRHFTGPPRAFWQTLLEAMVSVAGARLGVLLRRIEGAEQWQKMVVSPTDGSVGAGAQAFVRELDNLATKSQEKSYASHFFDSPAEPLGFDYALALRLDVQSKQETWVAAFFLPGCSEVQASAALKELRLVADMPAWYELQRASTQNQAALAQFSSVLDLLALLNAQERFLSVAMTFCNELASRHKCARVSLGWLDREYIRLQAINHTERFERKMEAVRALEQTMEEAFDQDATVVWPAPENDTLVSRDHETFSDQQKVKFLCSVPLRLDGEPVAVVLCERNTEPFPEAEVRLLGLCAEMAARRLSELKRRDRWFGARWALSAREGLATLVGVEHTWAKVVAVLVAVALGVLFFGKMNYRVEASFILRTHHLALLSAPFNGYIDEVPVEIGVAVKSNDVLLKLDTRDLRLEEAAAMADLDRFTREAEKARATNALAEMRIALAQVEQAKVRLDMVRYHLGQATLTAPFAGVIVEGDLKKRIAAPVKQGDLLFKIARTDQMYLECEVKENDIHEVRGDATGQIAFASQPKLKFPIQVERIEPVAQTKDQKNVFIVRAQPQGPVENWWRPGMSGIAKLSVGKRTFFWIISHRTIDFLRMYFWM